MEETQINFNDNLKTKRVLDAIDSANKELEKLNDLYKENKDYHILINSILVKEARESTEMDGVYSSFDDVYKYETKNGIRVDEAEEVSNCKKAIWSSFTLLKKEGYISVNLIKNIEKFVKKDDYYFKKKQGIIDKKTEEERLEEKAKDKYLSIIEEFVNNSSEDILFKIPLLLLDLEKVKLFKSFNGRIERILIILYLVQNKLLEFPILNMSFFFNLNKDVYNELLENIGENNNLETWIYFVIKGIEQSAKESIYLTKEINEEYEKMNVDFKKACPRGYNRDLAYYLFSEVYTNIGDFIEKAKVSRLTATNYLKALENYGVLLTERAGRDKIYKNYRLINILDKI